MSNEEKNKLLNESKEKEKLINISYNILDMYMHRPLNKDKLIKAFNEKDKGKGNKNNKNK